MSQTSGFFNAEQLMDGSYDRVYVAEQFAQYFSKFIGNGVFITPATQLKVVPTSGKMGVTVCMGDAYINGYWYKNSSDFSLDISNANGTTERIDIVVLRWDSLSRSIYLAVVEGEPSSDPVAPSITRDEDMFELQLAAVKIGRAVTSITEADITDKRNDNNVCGYVHGLISQIDTTNLFSQFTATFNMWFADLKESIKYDTDKFTVLFQAWFDTIKGQLEGDAATALQLQINKLNKAVYNFESKETYTGTDGRIYEVFGDGSKIITEEKEDGSIYQEYYNSLGILTSKKTIVEDKETGHIIENVTDVI